MTLAYACRLSAPHVRARHVVAVTLVAGVMHVAPAGAGTFTVPTCGAAPGGVNHAWALSHTAPYMTHNTACGPASGRNAGLIMRSARIPGRAQQNAFATAHLQAPPGTTISRIVASYRGYRDAYYDTRSHSGWAMGLFDQSNRLIYGCHHDSTDNCFVSAVFPPGTPDYNNGPYPNQTIDLPVGTTGLDWKVQCGYSSGCDVSNSGDATEDGIRANLDVYAATVTISDPTLPNLVGGRGVWTSTGWVAGNQPVGFDASDNTGISAVAAVLDPGPQQHAYGFTRHACDNTFTVPCPQGGEDTAVQTADVGDGAHTLQLGAVDGAGNFNAVQRTIYTDNHAPTRPTGLSIDGGEGWSQSNDRTLRWTNPGGQASPIVRAHLRLCKVSTGACRDITRDATDINTALDVSGFDGSGDYATQVWLEDQAGNQSYADDATDPVHLRFDATPPERIRFEPQDPNDPRRIAVQVADDASGLAGGTIQIRRAGSQGWRSLPTSLQGSHLFAYLRNDNLDRGRYELQAIAHDQAGNTGVGGARADGRPATLHLPLRVGTRVKTGTHLRRHVVCRTVRGRRNGAHGRRVRRCHGVLSVAPARRAIRVGNGRKRTLVGALQSSTGRGVRRQRVAVLASILGHRFRRVATVRTDRDGRFHYRLGVGPSRTIRFLYRGTNILRPARRDIEIDVPAASTIRASRLLVHRGQAVGFRGRLKGDHVPRGGRDVLLQAYDRGAWRLVAHPHADRRGRWRASVTFKYTRATTDYPFRLEIPREADYPYARGFSRRVVVRFSP